MVTLVWGGGEGFLGEAPPPWFLIILKKPWGGGGVRWWSGGWGGPSPPPQPSGPEIVDGKFGQPRNAVTRAPPATVPLHNGGGSKPCSDICTGRQAAALALACKATSPRGCDRAAVPCPLPTTQHLRRACGRKFCPNHRRGGGQGRGGRSGTASDPLRSLALSCQVEPCPQLLLFCARVPLHRATAGT